MKEMTEKFEYCMKCFTGMTSSGVCEELNKMGKEGWKLISNPEKLNCQGINTDLDMWVFIRSFREFNMIID